MAKLDADMHPAAAKTLESNLVDIADQNSHDSHNYRWFMNQTGGGIQMTGIPKPAK